MFVEQRITIQIECFKQYNLYDYFKAALFDANLIRFNIRYRNVTPVTHTCNHLCGGNFDFCCLGHCSVTWNYWISIRHENALHFIAELNVTQILEIICKCVCFPQNVNYRSNCQFYVERWTRKTIESNKRKWNDNFVQFLAHTTNRHTYVHVCM